jgi:hypothetical protein
MRETLEGNIVFRALQREKVDVAVDGKTTTRFKFSVYREFYRVDPMPTELIVRRVALRFDPRQFESREFLL